MPARHRLLVAFVVVSAAHLVSLVIGPSWLAWGTKAALMPTLVAWVWSQRGPALVVAALLLSWCGDVVLVFAPEPPAVITGMAFFAAAHGCYVWIFIRAVAVAGVGAAGVRGRRRALIIVYGVGWLILVSVLWSGLGQLRLPMVGYSLLLTATAVTSATYRVRAGAGGALFLLSDTLIALGLAGLPGPAGGEIWVMASYLPAQYLLASGALSIPERRIRITG